MKLILGKHNTCLLTPVRKTHERPKSNLVDQRVLIEITYRNMDRIAYRSEMAKMQEHCCEVHLDTDDALKSCIPEYTCGRSPVDPRGSSCILRGPESRPQQLFTASISLGLNPTEPYEIQLSRTSKIYFLSLRKCPFLPEGNGSVPGKLPYYNTKLYQQSAQVFCFAVLWFLFACLFVWWWGCYSL